MSEQVTYTIYDAELKPEEKTFSGLDEFFEWSRSHTPEWVREQRKRKAQVKVEK